MPEFRSGFVAVIGRPNAGKSTLINALVGQKVAAVSPRPQTTRRRQLGILTRPDGQIVFLDTPGLHAPRHKLGEFLNQEAQEAIKGVDIILWMVDASEEPADADHFIADLLGGLRKPPPIVLALNKIDRPSAGDLPMRQAAYAALIRKPVEPVSISAARGDGLEGLVAAILARLPVRPPEFEADQVTDLYEREIVADLVREAALIFLREEIPHSLAVRLDEFTERGEKGAYIAATLFVERETQKGIVIGEGGKMLKKIGSAARAEIEKMSGRKVFLELRVKVLKDWRNDENALKRFGYKIKK